MVLVPVAIGASLKVPPVSRNSTAATPMLSAADASRNVPPWSDALFAGTSIAVVGGVPSATGIAATRTDSSAGASPGSDEVSVARYWMYRLSGLATDPPVDAT